MAPMLADQVLTGSRGVASCGGLQLPQTLTYAPFGFFVTFQLVFELQA